MFLRESLLQEPRVAIPFHFNVRLRHSGNLMAPCEVTEDYYATLEIPQNATVEAIKKAYRQLSLARHPDRNPHDPNATSSFQCVRCCTHAHVSKYLNWF